MNKLIFFLKKGLAVWVLASLGVCSAQSLESDLRKEGSKVRVAYAELTRIFQTSSAVVYDGSKADGYGLVVSEEGEVLVKASELEELEELEEFTILIGKKKYREVEVLATDTRWDVALLKVDAKGLVPVDWSEEANPDRGTMVLSNGSTGRFRRRAQLGIIAASAREVRSAGLAVLGIAMSSKEEGEVRVLGVSPESGAGHAGVEKGDLINTIDEVNISEPEDLIGYLQDKLPGEVVRISLTRRITDKEPIVVDDPFDLSDLEFETEDLVLEVELGERQDVFEEDLTRNDQMSGEFSKRRTDFPRILQHDTSLSNRTTGGPLLTLDGKCLGMNIAYASRESSYAIPAKEIQELLALLRAEAAP